MTNNIGMVDRIIRVLLALTILVLYLAGTIGGLPAALLAVLAFALVFTAIIGWCPLYSVFHLSTNRKHVHQV